MFIFKLRAFLVCEPIFLARENCLTPVISATGYCDYER